jgi:uncharacterized repeat protein (TIGR01451 family)
MTHRLFVPVIAVAAALTILVALLATTAHPFDAKAAVDIGSVSIDTDVTGNVATPCDDYPCNDSTVLGPVNGCRVIADGETIDFDVVGSSIPAGGAAGSSQSRAGAGQSDMALSWFPNGAESPIQIVGKDRTVNLIHQGPNDNPAGQIDSTSNATTTTSGFWRWSDVDVNTDLAGEGGPGIAMRISIKGISPGTVYLSLATNLLGSPSWTDILGNSYEVGRYDGAVIVVGDGDCPTSTPSPAPTTPAPTTSPAPTFHPEPGARNAMYFDVPVGYPSYYPGQSELVSYFDDISVSTYGDGGPQSFHGENNGASWSVTLAPPDGENFQVKTYAGATEQGGSGHPRLNLYGYPAGPCYDQEAEFTVVDVKFTGPVLQSFAATFKQKCGFGMDEPLYGEVWYNSLASMPALKIVPGTLEFPRTIAGQTSAPQAVSVMNVGDSSIQFGPATFFGDDADQFELSGADSCSGQTIGPSDSCVINVAFAPDGRLNYKAFLQINDDLPTGEQVVPLSGSGAAGEIQVNGPYFNDVQVGTVSEPRTFSIYNHGDFSVTIQNISITGQNPNDFQVVDDPCTGTSLGPGLSCEFGVAATPTAPGQRRATISVQNDGLTSPAQDDLSVFAYNVADAVLSIGTPGHSTITFDALLTYRISVRNAGPDTLNGAFLVDVLPYATRFISISPSNAPCTTPEPEHTGTLTCEFPDVPVGAVVSIDVVVRVLQLGGTTLSNSAQVYPHGSDPVYQNNVATANINVVPSASDPSPTKTPKTPPGQATPTPTLTPAVGGVTQSPATTGAPSTSPVPTAAGKSSGDLNCDGVLDGRDVLALLGRVSEIASASACPNTADLNHDGKVSVLDAVVVLEYWAGLRTELP